MLPVEATTVRATPRGRHHVRHDQEPDSRTSPGGPATPLRRTAPLATRSIHATYTVRIESPDPISGTMLHAMVMPGYMATQRDIITSERVADKAAQLLKVEARGLQKKLDVNATPPFTSYGVQNVAHRFCGV